MKQDEKFNDILNDCLDRLFQGETVEECLQTYPDQASELEPLLRTAVAARVFSTVRPRPEFKSRARSQFHAALRDVEARQSRRWSFFGWRWRPQLQTGWAIALVAAIAVILSGGSTVAAASGSMPDQALYPVKLATESFQLAVTPSDIGKAELNAKFANRRVAEIEYLAARGDAQDVQNAVVRLNVNLENLTFLAGGDTVANVSQPDDMNILSAPGEPGSESKGNSEPVLGAASLPAESSPGPEATSQEMDPDPTADIAVMAPPARTPDRVGELPPADSASGNAKAADSWDGRNNNSELLALSPEQEKLREIITENYLQRQAILEKTLKKAAPDVRPAIRQAIARSEAEYHKAIQSLYLSSAP